MHIHRFSVPVNCRLTDKSPEPSESQHAADMYPDNGLILLPDSYSQYGAPTRLVINCHGAGGTVATDDSQMEHQALTQYLAANGYAVMDVNGLPEAFAKAHGIDLRNNVGSPIAVRSYVTAFRYCMDRFNLLPDVLVHGASMGGISSANLVLSGCIPVLAHSAFCPVLDTYNEIFLHPWSGGLPKYALGKLFGLEQDKSGEFIYAEEKIGLFNPARNPKTPRYPVPVKFWHCKDDPAVSFAVTEKLVESIRAAGGNAHLRAFPAGGHEPQLVGPAVTNPSGKTQFSGNELEINPAVEEAFLWLTNFG